MYVLIRYVFFFVGISLVACTPKTLTFQSQDDNFGNMKSTEFLDLIDSQTPAPNFDQTPYRLPENETFVFQGHIVEGEQIRVVIEKEGIAYTGYYTAPSREDTVFLAGGPQDPTKWNSKIELYELESDTSAQSNSFITDALDKYRSVYFELGGTYGKAGRKSEEGTQFVLYRENFSLSTYQLLEPIEGYSPKAILKALKASKDANDLREKLFNYNLILSRSDLIILEVNREQFTTFQPNEEFEVNVTYKNLFGDSDKEAVIITSYADQLFFYSFFYRESGIWKQVPSLVRISKESFRNEPCLELPEYPKNTFWLPKWEMFRGYEILTGHTIGGYCGTGIDRGSEVFYYIWQVDKGTARLLFSAREFSYQYSSPSPAPIGNVVKREFLLGKRLLITDLIQSPVQDEKGEFKRLETTKIFKTELALSR